MAPMNRALTRYSACGNGSNGTVSVQIRSMNQYRVVASPLLYAYGHEQIATSTTSGLSGPHAVSQSPCP